MDLEYIKEANEFRRNISTAYNEYKEFEGRKYTGMRVGGVRQNDRVRVSYRRHT